MFIVHTLDEIQGLIDAHAQFKATLGEADKEFQAIIALIHEVEGFAKQYNVPGANINPYTNLTGAVRKILGFLKSFGSGTGFFMPANKTRCKL